MAIFKTSGIVGAVSGKIGGVVFSKNGRARGFAVPTNPNTPKQARIRGIFGTIMTNWAALPLANQEAWLKAEYETTDRLGDVKVVRGSTLFVKANTLLLNAGLDQIDAPPTTHKDLTECYFINEGGAQWEATEDGLALDKAEIVISTPAESFSEGEYLHLTASTPASLGTRRKLRPVFVGVVPMESEVVVDGKITLNVTLAVNAGLGPSIYNSDSKIIMDVGIFNKGEGILRPIGQDAFVVTLPAPPAE